MAERVRAYLGIELIHQQNWDDCRRRPQALADALLNDHGVFIFKDSFKAPGTQNEDAARK